MWRILVFPTPQLPIGRMAKNALEYPQIMLLFIPDRRREKYRKDNVISAMICVFHSQKETPCILNELFK
jgi:hypothetical protein